MKADHEHMLARLTGRRFILVFNGRIAGRFTTWEGAADESERLLHLHYKRTSDNPEVLIRAIPTEGEEHDETL